MHVILTHEQADFDALASMMGAVLLHEQSAAVLPRKVNRNVRAFLNIYSQSLPFIDADDLPGSAVSHLTLVDTQSLVTLKGVSGSTKVQVIDHHQPKPNLPEAWTVRIDPTGACTTLLVEGILEQHIALSSLQATLLLLGIYEDTGSLTYASTTPRDVRAAAALLDMGASLRTAVEYLNPPLTPAQRTLYDYLLNSAKSHVIQGKVILIATAEAKELVEEISSIAHKLRDLLDPDALFLLIQTMEGIRLIARSTSDAINVATVAHAFGGGGHERAAAALFQPGALQAEDEEEAVAKAVEKLLEMLPTIVKPSITVAQLMSRNPLLITPETTAEEASRLMRRFGYEGYPVVESGKVVGLLTRRAVDRSLVHQMNLPARRLMEAGEVTVTPQDTLELLHSKMAETGWGQIPVVDIETGEIIGIVTRTDLVKAISAGEAHLPGRLNLASKLKTTLSPTRKAFLHYLAETAETLHVPVYIVGGFVRDLLLDRPSLDFDVVVEGDAILMAQMAAKIGGDVIRHTRFGTAKWRLGKARLQAAQALPEDSRNAEELPETLDFISSRTEYYDHPTALPTVSRSSIKLDLHRRDFTINTMALRLDGRHFGDLYDYFGGAADLHKGLVRVLHSLSFIDDPTRMLRAVRFEQRFGFKIEARTLELLGEALPVIASVSGDRLRHELNLILAEPDPARGLTRLDELGLLNAIHPGLGWDKARSDALRKAYAPIDPKWKILAHIGSLPATIALAYVVWQCQPDASAAQAGAQKIRLPAQLLDLVTEGCRGFNLLVNIKEQSTAEWTKVLDDLPRLSLLAISFILPDGEASEAIKEYIEVWQFVQAKTSAADLAARGIPPGPAYRQIISDLRAMRLNRQIQTDTEETAALDKLLKTKYAGMGDDGHTG
jgi:tRNA nucleotidyltransferase (CCA-adding enzyme)